MYRYDLHIHTSECDKYAWVGGAEIVRRYKAAGYDGLVITDHYESKIFDWFKNEIGTNNKENVIKRYLRGYYSARNEAEKIGFTVLCGAEVRFDNSINDYLVYGLEEQDFYQLPLLNKLQNIEELSTLLPKNALIVQAHPFRNNMTVCSPNNLFGIEGYNGCTEKIRNEMAKMFANHYNKAITSGSDFHEISKLAKGGIITNEKINSQIDLVNVLKSGDYKIIENY
ncbi:MAG: PHP domain-containing protein [Clostridia bacterium]|nr:PHP domain-containing protein [Clostridia bacterium]